MSTILVSQHRIARLYATFWKHRFDLSSKTSLKVVSSSSNDTGRYSINPSTSYYCPFTSCSWTTCRERNTLYRSWASVKSCIAVNDSMRRWIILVFFLDKLPTSPSSCIATLISLRFVLRELDLTFNVHIDSCIQESNLSSTREQSATSSSVP